MVRRSIEALRPWRRWFGDLREPLPRFVVRTRDGIRLVVRRARPVGPARGEPVMLLHGLAANHSGFDFAGRSFARWLSARGFDCYLPELRGHGNSERPHFRWSLDDYLRLDVPAVLEAIRSISGTREVHWVGHSMGGVLLLCYAALADAEPLASGVTVGSALDYRPGASDFRTLVRLRPMVEQLPAVPYGVLMHWIAPLIARSDRDVALSFNAWPTNIEPELARRLHASAFHTIPTTLLADLAGALEEPGLAAVGRRVLDHASDLDLPVLMLAGSRDRQVSVDAVRATADMLGRRARSHIFGTESGCADEYGHWDLLVGRNAETEVWPVVERWLLHVAAAPQ